VISTTDPHGFLDRNCHVTVLSDIFRIGTIHVDNAIERRRSSCVLNVCLTVVYLEETYYLSFLSDHTANTYISLHIMTSATRWSNTFGSVILLYFLLKAPRSLYMKREYSHITTDVLLATTKIIRTVK
jgi:hypothetical protein